LGGLIGVLTRLISAISNSSLKHLIELSTVQIFKGITAWRAFEDDETVINAINEWIEEQDQNFFCEGIKALKQRSVKSIDLRRICV